MTSRSRGGLIWKGLALAGLLFSVRSVLGAIDGNGTPVVYDDFDKDSGGNIIDSPMGDLIGPGAGYDDNYWLPGDIDQEALDMATAEQRVNAFLYMIVCCEHRYPQDVASDAAYSTFYGGTRFFNFADHPVNTGELKGVPLPPAMCVAAGFASGICVSTAAGAYQFTRPTWNAVRSAGIWGPRLPDFSIESQDEAARRLLQQIGALPYIQSGDWQTAIDKASATWASLPGSRAKQNPKPIEFAMARLNEGLAQELG